MQTMPYVTLEEFIHGFITLSQLLTLLGGNCACPGPRLKSHCVCPAVVMLKNTRLRAGRPLCYRTRWE